jgi:hypothetical protein
VLKSRLPFRLLQECVYKNLPFSRLTIQCLHTICNLPASRPQFAKSIASLRNAKAVLNPTRCTQALQHIHVSISFLPVRRISRTIRDESRTIMHTGQPSKRKGIVTEEKCCSNMMTIVIMHVIISSSRARKRTTATHLFPTCLAKLEGHELVVQDPKSIVCVCRCVGV